ncbi:MAG TPA: SagB/ThcOx family dehydrogenase [Vicinamibacterales bacterium]
MQSPAAEVFAYHERTKHHPFRYAAALGYMDWATQPDPFRRYEGAPLVRLDLVADGSDPPYERAFVHGQVATAPVTRAAIAQLFEDSLALSAWKRAGAARWALRVNPSSGNLHPTEGYLVCGAEAGLHATAAVYHYAPREHALERRAELSDLEWRDVAAALPPGALLLIFTSIYWRESWKYGERAFRYCQHDAGHAIAAAAIAAAGLGWRAALLERVTDRQLAALAGIDAQRDIEAEHPDCLLAIWPAAASSGLDPRAFELPRSVVDAAGRRWLGTPNRLSDGHHEWPAIDEVAAASEKLAPPGEGFWNRDAFDNRSLEIGDAPLSLRTIVRQRRSAVALDGRTGIERDAFYQILLKVLPGRDQVPFTTLPWRPAIDLLLFVHRVAGVAPGLYALLRDPGRRAALVDAMAVREFAWARPDGCPPTLPLYLLQEGDARGAARQTSCGQEIASDGVFAAAMLADFRPTIDAHGAWFYRRLHWEAGAIGQMLYLEAEASGIRGTGIGCFFDDPSKQVFGIAGDRFEVLYHFTMGGPVEDTRLQTEPPYAHLL